MVRKRWCAEPAAFVTLASWLIRYCISQTSRSIPHNALHLTVFRRGIAMDSFRINLKKLSLGYGTQQSPIREP